MLGPFVKDECAESACVLWDESCEVCAFLQISMNLSEIVFIADDFNHDCAIRVNVIKTELE